MTKAIVVLVVAGALSPSAAAPGDDKDECRFGINAEQMVACAARRFEPPGGIAQALSVWHCESGWAVEPPHTDPYHGPFQYLTSTFESQYDSLPDVTRWFELKRAVHDPRSNIVVAIAWAAHNNSWGPWSCA